MMQTTFNLPAGFDPTKDSILIGPSSPQPPVITLPTLPLTDFSAFLVERVLSDGSPSLTPLTGVKRSVYDTLTWTRRDYGQPGGYQAYVAAEDAKNGRWVGAWTFDPWTGFNAALGDGGQTVQNDPAYAYIMATQDGGKPGIQKFTGVGQRSPGNIPGTGWIICGRTPPTGSWVSTMAWLNINGALPLNAAFTRWRMELLPITFTVFGTVQAITLPCLISEHYNGVSIAAAVSMEQSVYAMGWGEVWWAEYATQPSTFDFSRVPNGNVPWQPPSERVDFTLQDARLWTQILPISAGEATTVQWPPVGFVQ